MDDILELTEAKIFQNLLVQLKNRFSEKPTKIWKKSPTCFDVNE